MKIKHTATHSTGQVFTRTSKSKHYSYCVAMFTASHEPGYEWSASWTTRLDLAQKVANSWSGYGTLVEILPAMTDI